MSPASDGALAFNGECSISDCKASIKETRSRLAEAHREGLAAHQLLAQHSDFIDSLLIRVWAHFNGNRQGAELVAAGGYGRQELHPFSDIDLLILLERSDRVFQGEVVEPFVRFLWDIGLEVGHSTRTLKECISQAREDVTVVTNLMESRLIVGSGRLLTKLQSQISPSKMWSARKFFEAKRQEQIQRHTRFGDTAYNLEPQIKEGPGGLRDIQTIQWVGARYFGGTDLNQLARENFLTEDEVSTLIKGREFLWRVRNSLHFLAGRCEDRLLFDYQREIASEFKYKDTAQLAVEKLMKRYFRTVKELRLLNDILLQHLEEAILHPGRKRIQRINRRLRTVDGMLETANDDIFERQPFALLEIFLVLAQQPDIRGIRGNTVRLIRENVHRINTDFRKDLRCRALFMEILKAPSGLTHVLRRMDAYGVLAAYIPAFGRVTGQMQHDLFHVYTVEAHLLFVVRNLRRLDIPKHDDELPECSRIMQRLFKKHRLYLAALFHDIAKGRGGDHSTLGEKDAIRFCKRHDLSDYDANFVAWLVRAHLLMSWFAQREDISDPEVIERFASEVGDQERLDNLYLLTVADMRATSPKVWNDWKGKLLSDLYHHTSRALRRGIGAPIDAETKIRDIQAETLGLLKSAQAQAIPRLWHLFDPDYFLRNDAEALAWHGSLLLHHSAAELPIVDGQLDSRSHTTKFFICCPDSEELLSHVTAAFDRLRLNIVDARVHRLRSNLVILIFVVMPEGAQASSDHGPQQTAERLRKLILHPAENEAQRRHPAGRALKHFPIETTVKFSTLPQNPNTVMEVIAQDRPGLLLAVAKAMLSCKIRLVTAKVATFGEKAEDIFYITDRDGNPLNDATVQEELADRIRASLPSQHA